MGGGKEWEWGDPREGAIAEGGKAGKRASRVPCKGHTETKARVDIPGEMSCRKSGKAHDFPEPLHPG